MKRKIYLLAFICVSCIGSLFAQDTLHVGESLFQMITNASDGATIIVESGLHDAQGQSITITNKSITIKGEEGEEKPLVYIEELDVSGTDVDIILEGIEFSGATYDSLTGENTVELEATYLINLLDGHTSCNNIILRNCIVRDFKASAIRGDRSANTADSIIIDNCIMYNFRGDSDYGPFRMKDDITVNAFIIKNSTIYNFLNKLIDFQDVVPSQMDITVENCTFYKWGGGKDKQYLFDIQDNTDARLYIKSCIFGKTNSEQVTVRAFRFPPAVGINYAEISHTVMTPDFIVDTTGGYDRMTWDKAEWNEVDFDPEFEDPENGNFNIPEGSPVRQMSPTGGPIGDPRWCVAYSGISELEIGEQIQVYPNPAGNVLYLKYKLKDNNGFTVNIYSLSGQVIKSIKKNNRSASGIMEIVVDDFRPGIYFVQFINNNNTITRKICINH